MLFYLSPPFYEYDLNQDVIDISEIETKEHESVIIFKNENCTSADVSQLFGFLQPK